MKINTKNLSRLIINHRKRNQKFTPKSLAVVHCKKALPNSVLNKREIARELNDLFKIADKVVYNKEAKCLGIIIEDLCTTYGNHNLGYAVIVFSFHTTIKNRSEIDSANLKIFMRGNHSIINCHLSSDGSFCYGSASLSKDRFVEGRITDAFEILVQMIKTG